MNRAVVTLLLVTPLAVTAAVAPNVLLELALEADPPEVHHEAPVERSVRVPQEREYLDVILGRNLFDPAAIGHREGGRRERLTRQVRLVGTVVAEPERYSAAFVSHSGDAEAQGYNLGHHLLGAEIVAIDDLKVTVRHPDGKTEVLVASEGPREPAPPAVEVPMESLEELAKQARAFPHRGPDGVDGYRLSAIRKGSLAEQLGLRNADIVHAVNGLPITSPAEAMQAFQELQDETELTAEITRRGQRVEVRASIR